MRVPILVNGISCQEEESSHQLLIFVCKADKICQNLVNLAFFVHLSMLGDSWPLGQFKGEMRKKMSKCLETRVFAFYQVLQGC